MKITMTLTARMYVFWISTLVFVFLQTSGAPPKEVFIGCLLSDSHLEKTVQQALQLGIDYINSKPDVLPNTTLIPLYNTSRSLLASFGYIQSTCYLAQNDASILIGPGMSTTVKATHPVSSGMHIPQITPYASDPTLSLTEREYPYLLKMSVPDSYQSEALIEIVKRFSWSRVAIINSLSDYGRNGLERFRNLAVQNHWLIRATVQFYPSSNISSVDLTDQLRAIKNKGVRVVILNCLAPHARVILDQANDLEMMTKGWAWLLTDGISTMDGLFDPCQPVPTHLQGLIATRPPFAGGQLAGLFDQLWNNGSSNLNTIKCASSKTPYNGYALRAFDAVLVAAQGLHDFLSDGHNLTREMSQVEVCSAKTYSPRSYGETLMKYLSQVNVAGVMSQLSFTDMRYPSIREYEVVNLMQEGWRKIGEWSSERPGTIHIDSAVTFPGNTTMTPVDTSYNLKDVHFKIVMIEEAPFLMKTSAAERRENSSVLYKGFCVDIVNTLQQSLGFTYSIHLVKDGQFGMLNPMTKQWDGMIGEIERGEADMAVASMAITYERQQVVDFTKPYLDLGLVIIMSKEKSQWNLLGFLEPFEWDLWIAVVASFLVSGIAVSVCSYCSPYGYRGRHIQADEVTRPQFAVFRHTFSFYNSLWFSFASWQKQGSALSPLCFSGRIVYGFWWFAITVITATYTANLAAFLTVRRLDTGVHTIADLARQREIKYGTVQNTAAERYFEMQIVDPYKRAYAFMMAEQTWVHNASHGIDKVRNSFDKPKDEQYAFIYDSTLIEYAVNQPPCTMQSVGRIFNNFGYGIAFKKGSPYTDIFSLHLLKLRQSPYMEERRSFWFSGPCKDSSTDEPNTGGGEKASLGTMAGVFYFLLLGLCLGLIIVPIELCVAACKDVHCRKVRTDEEMTWSSALWRRLVMIWRSKGDCFHGCFSGTIADPGQSNSDTDTVKDTNYQTEHFSRLDAHEMTENNHASHTVCSNGAVNHAFSFQNDDNISFSNSHFVDNYSFFTRTHSQHNGKSSEKLSDDSRDRYASI